MIRGRKENNFLNEKRKTLLKQTRFFSKQKYLLMINLIDRKILKVSEININLVFEEYESLYLV